MTLGLALVLTLVLVSGVGCHKRDPSPFAPTPVVVELAILDFSLDSYNITHGSTTTMHWLVEGATSVRIDSGGVAPGDVPSKGSLVIMPAVSTWYSITASSATKLVKRTITIEVRP
jgi:hypothetical protein